MLIFYFKFCVHLVYTVYLSFELIYQRKNISFLYLFNVLKKVTKKKPSLASNCISFNTENKFVMLFKHVSDCLKKNELLPFQLKLLY